MIHVTDLPGETPERARMIWTPERARAALRYVLAIGGWKYREGIPFSDEQVEGQGIAWAKAVVRELVELTAARTELAVARQVIRELGRPEYYQQRLREVGR